MTCIYSFWKFILKMRDLFFIYLNIYYISIWIFLQTKILPTIHFPFACFFPPFHAHHECYYNFFLSREHGFLDCSNEKKIEPYFLIYYLSNRDSNMTDDDCWQCDNQKLGCFSILLSFFGNVCVYRSNYSLQLKILYKQ